MEDRYNSLSSYFRNKYGKIVRKITISLGFTCPNIDGTVGTGGCIYCHNGSMPPLNSRSIPVKQQIENGIEVAKKRYGNDIFCMAYFQTNSNTYAPVDELKRIYDTVLDYPEIIGMEVGTRPDCADTAVIALLQGYIGKLREVWLELGLQSANDETLKKINRGHSVSDFTAAIMRAKQAGLKTAAHIIMGFPWETETDMRASMKLLVDLKVDGVKIHPLYINKDTALAAMYEREPFLPLSYPDYINILADCVEMMPPEMVLLRFTAEGDEKLLIEPDYCRVEYKNRIKNDLNRELIRRKFMEQKNLPAGK